VNFRAWFSTSLFLLLPPLVSAQTAPLPGGMRLGDGVTPRAYDLRLTVDPNQSELDGEGDIEVTLRSSTQRIWINAHQLGVSGVVAEAGGRKIAGLAQEGDEDVIGLSFAETLPAGEAKISLRWKARIESLDTRGVFRQRDGEAWYAYTQFESLSARRAFPCFDEPQWKTPWRLQLTVRDDHLAFANSPQAGEAPASAGWKTIRFEPTPPLPSYLVAFAVGPFEVLDGGKAGAKATPLRYVAPRGHGGELAYVRETTPKILERLETYFGTPYPFAKLDSVVIPHTVGFSAMENAALITYTSNATLARPEAATERFKQRYAALAAHEIAHQWFGDFVTMAWWDDLWLNESFATWLSERIVDEFAPEWYWPLRIDEARRQAIEVDRLPSTRIVRQPVQTRDDLANAFDRITYNKGGAVLATFEAWLGPERFRDGVRRYLARHAWGNAAADDFFAALAADDAKVARAFSGFIRNPGLPEVSVERACAANAAQALLQQMRLVPKGLVADAAAPWATPLCLRAGYGEASERQCVLLEGEREPLRLARPECPDFLLGNPAGRSYAVVKHAPDDLDRIFAAGERISAAEVIAVMHDAELLALSGRIPYAQALRALAWGAARPEPPVLAIAAEIARRIPGPHRGDARAFASWVQEHFGASARAAGWRAKPEEQGEAEQLRMSLLPLVAELGRDRALGREARRLARAWLKRPEALDAAAVEPVLRTAARLGDPALFNEYLRAARHVKDRTDRRQIVSAMGRFQGSAGKGFRAALRGGKLDPREGLDALELALGEEGSRSATLAWIAREYDWLNRAMPQDSLARVPRWASGACTPEQRNDLAAFWTTRAGELRGLSRTLALALETIDGCIAARPVTAK